MKRRVMTLICLGALVALTGCNQPKYRGKTASMWAGDLAAKDDYKRRLACESLGKMGADAAAQVEKVAAMLDDVNPGVQGFCADALGKMGTVAVPGLEPHLKSASPFVRMHAASALMEIDPAHADARATLINGFTGLGNADLSRMAKDIILRHNGTMVSDLVGVLSSPHKDLRLETIKALGFLEAHARGAVDPLIGIATKDPEWTVRKAAIQALAAVATVERSTPVFRAAIEEDQEAQEEVRDAAAMMLKFTGARESATGMEGAEEAAAVEDSPGQKPAGQDGISITIK